MQILWKIPKLVLVQSIILEKREEGKIKVIFKRVLSRSNLILLRLEIIIIILVMKLIEDLTIKIVFQFLILMIIPLFYQKEIVVMIVHYQSKIHQKVR